MAFKFNVAKNCKDFFGVAFFFCYTNSRSIFYLFLLLLVCLPLLLLSLLLLFLSFRFFLLFISLFILLIVLQSNNNNSSNGSRQGWRRSGSGSGNGRGRVNVAVAWLEQGTGGASKWKKISWGYWKLLLAPSCFGCDGFSSDWGMRLGWVRFGFERASLASCVHFLCCLLP